MMKRHTKFLLFDFMDFKKVLMDNLNGTAFVLFVAGRGEMDVLFRSVCPLKWTGWVYYTLHGQTQGGMTYGF